MTPLRQLRRDLAWKPTDAASVRWTVISPLVILAMTLVVIGITLVADHYSVENLKARLHEEHRLKMDNSRDHVESYFDSLYSTLLFITLDDDVRAHRVASRQYLKRMFEHERNEGMLREIIIAGRDFTGTNHPFLRFGHPVSLRTHTVEDEKEEYDAIAEHLRQFTADARLKAQISREISICGTNLDGRPLRGVVFSLPIRSQGMLAGSVSAVVDAATLEALAQRGLQDETAFLVNSAGEYIGQVSPSLRAELQRSLPPLCATAFPDSTADSFPVARSIAMQTPVNIAPGKRWCLVYLYDKRDYIQHMAFHYVLGRVVLVGSLAVAGVALALLIRVLGRRLNEHAAQLNQRMAMEREIQEVSEREQRRIGEVMHEDLCQRLNGLEAASRTLEKRLSAADAIESRIAGEISREIHSSLTRFREIAEELQPVPLFEDGFVAAIQLLAAHVESRHGIKCCVETPEDEPGFDLLFSTNLFRITQEALNNVVKHASADRVVIAYSASAGRGVFTITDNGRGIREAPASGKGMGLRMMQYRCDLIGAELEIGRGPGGGTRVRASWPQKPARTSLRGRPGSQAERGTPKLPLDASGPPPTETAARDHGHVNV